MQDVFDTSYSGVHLLLQVAEHGWPNSNLRNPMQQVNNKVFLQVDLLHLQVHLQLSHSLFEGGADDLKQRENRVRMIFSDLFPLVTNNPLHDLTLQTGKTLAVHEPI